MNCDHDQAFLQILKEEKNITNFLDVFFGFLYRCTDFYVESGPDQKLGFQPGLIEKLVLNSFQKWKNISKFPNVVDLPKNHDSNVQYNMEIKHNEMGIEEETGPQVVQEIEVETSTENEISDRPVKPVEKDRSSDSYNGAVRDNYTWSQTINNLDVLVKLPSCIKTSKDLKVHLNSKQIKIEARTSTLAQCQEVEDHSSEWTIIFMGEFSFKVKNAESVWTIVPGGHVSIHFEKVSERWWDALIVGEPKIDLSKIDCSRNLEEMGSEAQMKVQELMWNHQQKLLGKPTTEQIKMEKILKKAWDAEGSPFTGTPYDPSTVQFSD
ncbi:NudC domain-containing protein 3 [Dufourea novaeangliae]|uniref:NudC domain-containing protein 3 n=2 Tax=Dufourea novaeangliae TaxID=178035 RepID=A0A154P906_DUFNO|nr:NudC domain-containing protein 3 [Dufourea novaeangliae]